MGLHLPIGYVQLNFKVQLLGKPAPFVFTMGGFDNPLVPGTMEDKINDLRIALQGGNSLFGASRFIGYYTFRGINATYMTEQGPMPIETVSAVTGTKPGNALPSNCALLVRKNTGLGGKQNRGRFFLPPAWIDEESVDPSGTITGSVLDLEDFLGQLLSDMTDVGIPPRLLHSDPELTPAPITSLSLQSKIATQRRRLR